MTGGGRAFAALVAASAWLGLAVQFGATLGATGSAAATLWVLLRYFTVLVNLAVGLTFTRTAARGAPAPPALFGGLVLNALLVAIVYHLLLAGTLAQTAPETFADAFLHGVTPSLVLLFWLMRVERGALRFRDVAPWAAVPLIYFAYALARGGGDGIYPYPFIDVGRIGWVATLVDAAVIAAGFVAAGLGLVWFDRRLGSTATVPPL